MIVLEFKIKAKTEQYQAIDEAIKTTQFIRNKCLRFWMDNQGVGRYDLNKHCKVLAQEFSFAERLNSMARQSAAERAWSAISRFFDNCKKKIPGKKGYPRFKKNVRSVEYKTSGWKYEDLKVKNMIRNHNLSKSIQDMGWRKLRSWIEYFGVKFGKITIAVPPHFTTVDCSVCGAKVQKSLSTRTHRCNTCFAEMCRDRNAAANILQKAIRTVGHTGTWEYSLNAWGDLEGLSPGVSPGACTPRPSWAVGANLLSNGESIEPRIP
jgi:transposase